MSTHSRLCADYAHALELPNGDIEYVYSWYIRPGDTNIVEVSLEQVRKVQPDWHIKVGDIVLFGDITLRCVGGFEYDPTLYFVRASGLKAWYAQKLYTFWRRWNIFSERCLHTCFVWGLTNHNILSGRKLTWNEVNIVNFLKSAPSRYNEWLEATKSWQG